MKLQKWYMIFSLFLAVGLALALSAGTAAAQKPPPPKVTADCSPGYYKNHPEAWCGVTCPATGTVQFTGATCDLLLDQLNTHGPGGAAIREDAKGRIDACFGTAVASPCEDD